jgi:DNA gyrase subunit A
MIAIQQTARNGTVVAAALGAARRRGDADLDRRRADPHQGEVDPRDEPLDAGVTLINLGEGEKLAGLERVVEREDDEE